jgi:hypothetical protein
VSSPTVVAVAVDLRDWLAGDFHSDCIATTLHFDDLQDFPLAKMM